MNGEQSLGDQILSYLFRVFGNFWTRWPFKLFVLYLATILAFGFLYRSIHNRSPQSFAFQSDILDTKNAELRGQTLHDIQATELVLNEFKQLQTTLASTTQVPKANDSHYGWESFSFFVDKYEFMFDISPFPQVDDGTTRNMIYVLMPGKVERWGPTKEGLVDEPIELSNRYKKPYQIEAYQEMTRTLIAQFQDRLKQKQEYLHNLANNAPDYWSYWDFVYFSAITQTTVGYGDILPNSTLVRLVVTVQILLSMFILIVALNMASTDLRKIISGRTLDQRITDSSQTN